MTNRVKAIGQFDDKISGPLDKVRDKFDRLQKQGAKGIAIGAGAAITAKGLDLIGSAMERVTGFIGDSISAYREQQVASAKLDASLEANVAGWQGNTQAIEDANRAGMALGFTDTEVASSLAGLVGATHDINEAVRIQGVAMDLARYKGISLADASEALTKVEAGSYRILKSLGIELKANATQTEALAAVEKIAGAQASKYAETDLGKLAVASANVEQAQEKLGVSMSHVGAVVIPATSNFVSSGIDGWEMLGEKLGDFIDKGGIIGHLLGNDVNPELQHMARGTEDIGGKLADDLVPSLDASTDAWGDNGTAIERVDGFLDDTEEALRRTDAALQGLGDELYGGAILEGRLADAQQTLNEKIKEGPNSKSAADVAIWRGEVAEAQKNVLDLGYAAATLAGGTALEQWFKDTRKTIADTDQAGLAYLSTLRAIAQITGTVPSTAPSGTISGGRLGGKAAGGPVEAGVPILVGEKGPEIFMPDSGGSIIPNGEIGGSGTPWGGGGGGGEVIELHNHIHLDGRQIAESVQRVAYYRSSGPSRFPRG